MSSIEAGHFIWWLIYVPDLSLSSAVEFRLLTSLLSYTNWRGVDISHFKNSALKVSHESSRLSKEPINDQGTLLKSLTKALGLYTVYNFLFGLSLEMML